MSQSGLPEEPLMQWFALYVKLRHEKVVSELLLRKGFESFLPSYLERKSLRNKMYELDMPLFPGYVFAKFDPQFRLPILTTPGVQKVVGYGRVPVPIPTREIDTVRDAVDSKLRVEPCQYLAAGSRVRIVYGPLAGVEGILEETRSGCRVIVSVSLIQRSIRVEVDRDMLLADDIRAEKASLGQYSRPLHSIC